MSEMNHTVASINLKYISADDPRNRARSPGSKIAFEWECPGDHHWERRTVAYVDENPTEEEILRDPYCWYCRKARIAAAR